MTRPVVIACSLLSLVASARCVQSQPPSASDVACAPFDADPQLQQLLTDICRKVIPHDYENAKHWGRQTEAIRGLYVRRDGLRIKTHRTKKLVNHGTWSRYRAALLDPNRRLQIRLEKVRRTEDHRLAFDLVCAAGLELDGRVARWERGVQLLNLSAEAEADVVLTLHCDVALQLEFDHAFPAVQLDPIVRRADLHLAAFRLHRISRAQGPVVAQLGNSVQRWMEGEIEQRNEKLLAQIQRQIDKNRAKLRVSLSAALGRFVSS